MWLTWVPPSRHVTDEWGLAWAGFDAALPVAVALIGVGILRRAPWLQGAATAAGTMLLVDVWFDITLSSGGARRMGAVAEALVSEVPLALLAFWIAADIALPRAVSAARISRRPVSARPRVTSSAYSRSPPTGQAGGQAGHPQVPGSDLRSSSSAM